MMRKLTCLVLGVVAALVPLTSLAAAATATPTASGGQGLEITPPVVQLDAQPGQTVSVKIGLRNITSGPLVVTSAVNDFGAKDETGEPQILLGQDTSSRFSLKQWIQPLPTTTLQSQQQQTFVVPIAVPTNAEPGGHYAVIRFSGTPPSVNGTGVSLSASLGTLVLLRVAGKITEGLSTVEFFTSAGGTKHSFFDEGPITLSERLRNTGNVHVAPTGSVTITGMFGKHLATLSVNGLKGNILPDSVRRFDQTVTQKHLFGRYRATFDLVYGSSQRHISDSIVFWVIPWKLILIILLVMIVLVSGLWFGVRRYNRYILARSRK